MRRVLLVGTQPQPQPQPKHYAATPCLHGGRVSGALSKLMLKIGEYAYAFVCIAQ